MQFPEEITAFIQEAFRYQLILRKALGTHLQICGMALSVGTLLGLPLGFVCSRQPRLAQGIFALFNTVRVIPGLALLVFLLPVLGTGTLPGIVALVILALPSILLNTCKGFEQVGTLALETAKGLGLNGWQAFARVQLPLALPFVINGLRIATVEVISGATLVAFIGGGGLGTLIVNGLSTYNFTLLLAGALPVALLALLAEIGFNRWTRLMTRYQTC